MSILNMNAESYRKFTQAKQPVMVEFSAPWCVYCRRQSKGCKVWSASTSFAGKFP